MNDARIVSAWHDNADAWIRAVREQRIESRRLVTDRAIVDAVLARRPASVIDIGCGEGWLCRRLGSEGIEVVGLDVVPELVDAARAADQHGGEYAVCAYDALGQWRRRSRDGVRAADGGFDAAVCNFSLIGQAVTEDLVRCVPSVLARGGVLLVQTLHPPAESDGWRTGSWAGIEGCFADAAPWYARSLESWRALFSRNGFTLVDEQVPVHPRTGIPASVIFVAEVRA